MLRPLTQFSGRTIGDREPLPNSQFRGDGMRVVREFGEMWARNTKNLAGIPSASEPGGKGVYVLYDGSMPVYVGKGDLYNRINGARTSKRRGQLWDHFSWYSVKNAKVTHDVEALVLRMLLPYLRSLTKQKGKFLKAKRVKENHESADHITRKAKRS
jgi:hypothetical protein